MCLCVICSPLFFVSLTELVTKWILSIWKLIQCFWRVFKCGFFVFFCFLILEVLLKCAVLTITVFSFPITYLCFFVFLSGGVFQIYLSTLLLDFLISKGSFVFSVFPLIKAFCTWRVFVAVDFSCTLNCIFFCKFLCSVCLGLWVSGDC